MEKPLVGGDLVINFMTKEPSLCQHVWKILHLHAIIKGQIFGFGRYGQGKTVFSVNKHQAGWVE